MKFSTVLFTVLIGLCAPSFSSFALEQIDFEQLSQELTKDSKNSIAQDMADNLHRISIEQRSMLSKQAKKIAKGQIASLATAPKNHASAHDEQSAVVADDVECD